jgi:hypothetical protein
MYTGETLSFSIDLDAPISCLQEMVEEKEDILASMESPWAVMGQRYYC